MEDVLDDGINDWIHDYLMENEEIIWQGKPAVDLNINVLKGGFQFASFIGFSPWMSIPLFIWGIYLLMAISEGEWEPFIGFSIFCGVLFTIPAVFRFYRKTRTSYALTSKRMCFRIWRWGKSKIYYLDLAQLAQVYLEEHEGKIGIIHLMPKTPVEWETHDFISGEARHYPTLELIHDADKVKQIIEIQRSKRLLEIEKRAES